MAVQPTLPVREWTKKQRVAVERKALEILEGVGVPGEEHWQLGSLALHYRRPMTVKEALGLPDPKRATPEEVALAHARLAVLEAQGVLRDGDVEPTIRVSRD